MNFRKKYRKFLEKFKILLFRSLFRLTLRTHAFTKGIFFVKGYIDKKYIDFLKENIFSYVSKNPRREIFILIDTDGGSVTDSLYFYDFIKSLEVKTTSIVMGKCHSAGLIILASCEKRLSLKHSTFLFHQMKSILDIDDFQDRKESISSQLERHKKYCESIYNIQEKDFGLSREKIRKLGYDGKEYNKKLFPDEVLKLGVIHEIVEKLPFHF